MDNTRDNLSPILVSAVPEHTPAVAYAWYVGAQSDGVDYTDTFVNESRWENGWDNKFIDDVKSIKVGDRIVIKSSYTKKNGLPFDANGKIVGVMGIKAIGEVTENPGDGKNLKVNWKKVLPIKMWYGLGTLRQTVHLVSAAEGMIKSALLKFTFEDLPQDYSVCEEHYKDEPPADEESIITSSNLPTIAKGGFNKIFYGAPGCGKSRFVSDMLKKANVPQNNVIRVTFHPEYANCDFIGQILPTVEEKIDRNGEPQEIVKYIFNAGPFTLALNTAYNTTDMVYLVIEEINRGNAAAIFGDMFQLLDRVREPEEISFSASEYPVCNPNMQKYLFDNAKNTEIKTALKTGVFIPSNLTIFATMNSSDQNVFTLDTAFKRRWSFEQISNDITKDQDHPYKKWFVPGTDITWELFLTKINEKILDNKIYNQTNEDKRLGKYFVTKECLTESPKDISKTQDIAKNFAYKVIEYIWNDVCKIGREEWFDLDKYKTLEDVIEAYLNPNEGTSPMSVFDNISFQA